MAGRVMAPKYINIQLPQTRESDSVLDKEELRGQMELRLLIS